MKKLFVILLGGCFISANAASWRLNNNPAVDADFRTFAEAQTAAAEGDTIYIEGNGIESHYGNITITKKLVLIGPGYFLNENDSTYASANIARALSLYIQSSAPGTQVYGLYIYTADANTNRLRIRASDVIVSRNYFYPSPNNDIFIDADVQNVTISQNYAYQINVSATASNIIITNNCIIYRIYMNNTSSAIITNNVVSSAVENVFNSQIKNNIIFNVGYHDPLSVGGSGNYIAYNLLSGAMAAGTYGPGNVANVDMSTVFVGYPSQGNYSTDGRFQLKSDGPAAGAGEGGMDCGMFSGSLPYVLSGLPPVPHIYEAIVPTAGSTVSGLPVIIKAKSQN